MLQEIKDHIMKGVSTLDQSTNTAGNITGAASKGLCTVTSEMIKTAICELKKGSEILSDYLGQFPDN